jgi:RHS repeat-associated protein
MFALKSCIETASRVLLSAIILLNALTPTAVLTSSWRESQKTNAAYPNSDLASNITLGTPRSQPYERVPILSEQIPVLYNAPQITYPQRTSPEKSQVESPVPPKEQVEFAVTADPAIVPANGVVTLHVLIRNHSTQELKALVFSDSLESGLEYKQDSPSPVTYDSTKKQVTYALESLQAGQEFAFSYSVTVTPMERSVLQGKLWLHNVELTSSESGVKLKTSVALGNALTAANAQSQFVALNPAGGWNRLGRVSVNMPQENVGQNALIMLTPAKVKGKGPDLQFELDVVETSSPSVDAANNLDEQAISLAKQNKAPFKKPAFLEINLGGYVDLQHVPAGQEPYVATYDEEHKVWVKVPILETDPVDNSVTVEATHFSTWGAGLGNSLPQNGTNVLLFDQPYISLFTGAARYSIPIWTPAGRAGMQPDISLSYSSGTVDGVLGDVQAPWVGVGWNIDDIEIVRKITTDENGYGYRNEFALTLNGTLYQLVRDEFHQNRFFTDKAAFLYIERHNYALNNNPSTANTTGEWWEVVTTDGTRYRLGWNQDSEQLALMYGYACTTNGLSCITPDGAYASLGYAGKAQNLVALRWRVDKVSDAHGNYMEYSYDETQPASSTTLAPFDRESYLRSIRYTGFDDPDSVAPHLEPAYQVVFNRGDRSTIGDVPTEFNIWDNIDARYLSSIWSCYGQCATDGSNAIRKYQFGYSLANVPNANGTLTLTSLDITGGGYTENGQTIPATSAPTIRFTYQDKDNRASGNGDVFKYPRLVTIDNGSGGLLTFTYENDGRANNSWYNYRVQNVMVDSGMGLARKQSYTYAIPVYSGQNGNSSLGSLIGYTTATESLLDFSNNDAAIVKTKHTFGTTGLDVGREMQTKVLDSSDTVLRKTTNVYVTDNSGAPKDNNGNPFPGWNYRYLGEMDSYELSGGNLTLVSKSTYYNDPYTGNALAQSTYLGNSLYRKTYYEYVTNPDIRYYILDKVSRVLLVDAGNQIYSDTRYHYDGQINQTPTRGDVTLVQRLTGNSNQTIDTVTDYNVYGSAVSVKAYRDYGTVNSYPAAAYWESTMAYDSVENDPAQSYPISATNALGQSSSMAYLHTLGVPYQSTDPNGWTTTTTYDGLGRTLSVTPPGLNQPGTWYIYPSPNAQEKIPAPHSVEMQILDTIAGKYRSVWGIYDGAGRMLQTQVDEGNKLLVNTTLFNAQGLAMQQSLPYEVNGTGGNYVYDSGSQFTTALYDALGRTTSVTAPGNITTTTSYDGLTTTTIDPNGNKVSRTADGLGRMISVAEFSDPNTVYATTTYFYDSADRLIRVKDAKLTTTTIQYDWLGRKLGMDDPDMGVWSYGYDSLGNMTSQTDARGHELTFAYDALDRLVTKSDDDPNTADSTYTYGTQPGTIGLRTGMTDQSGSSGWSYSNYGRTVTEARTIGGEQHTITTNADWLGRAIDTTYDDGEVVSYTYDDLGRPRQLKSNQSANILVDLAYNMLGQISTQTLGNGTVVTNTYDANTNRLTNRKVENGSTTQLDLSYDYDANGNITRLTDRQPNETQFYTYDFLNRLTSAIGAQGTPAAAPATPQTYGQQFEYDKVGNIEQINNWGTPPTLQQQGRAPSDNFDFVNYTAPKLQAAEKALLAPVGDLDFVNYAALRPQALEKALPAPVYQEEPTATPSGTPMATPSETPTPTLSPTVTNTPVPTNTPGGTATPSTTPTPVLEDSNTVSLLHMNGTDGATTFTDESGKTWTANGNAQIDTAQSKFGGASLFADGNGDYLYTPDNEDFNFGSGDFTVDMWVRFNALPSASNYAVLYSDLNGTSFNQLYVTNAAGSISLRWVSKNSGSFVIDTGAVAWTPTTGTWYHLAAVRNGSQFDLYVNGVSIKSVSGVSGAVGNPAASIAVGAQIGSTSNTTLNGWIDEVRVSKGIARWTSNFIPPTSEYIFTIPTPTNTPTLTPTPMPTSTPGTDDAYTVALLHMNGVNASTTFTDESGKVWTAYGNAQIATAQSRFGGASSLFDGTGDRIDTPDHNDFNVGSGDWTVDYWVRTTGSNIYMFGQAANGSYPDNGATTSVYGWVRGNGTARIGMYNGTTVYYTDSVTPINDGSWRHIAGIRYGSTLYIAVDGVLEGSVNVGTVAVNNSTNKFAIGAIGEYTSNRFNGSIDEFRFSKGIARWTSNFTPPSSEYLPRTMSESLVAHWDFENVTGTTVPDVATSNPYNNVMTLQNGAAIVPDGANGSAVSFDGTNDSATVANQTEIKRNGSFSLFAWINPSALVTDHRQYIINKEASSSDYDYGFITTSGAGAATPTPPANVDADGKLIFRVGDLTPNKVIGPILPVSTWTLVTGVYDSARGELRLYINGTLSAVEKVTGTVSMGTGPLSFSPSGNLYYGKLDDVRFYDRALTNDEVLELFGTFATPTPLPSPTPTATSEATFTPTPTPLPASAQQWGTGNDGDLTVSGTFNINTNGSNGRSCADGVNYSVTGLTSSRAYLSPAPTAACLQAGDEVMLINLQGVPGATYNTGTYEFLRVASLGTDYVQFTTMKLHWYGAGWRSDNNIGAGTGQQRVMLMRVPNYHNVTVSGTLTGTGWNKTRNGVVAFRVSGTLSGSGTITIISGGYWPVEGYAGQSVSYAYGGGESGPLSPGGSFGGGGGYATNGQDGTGHGGLTYGRTDLSQLFPGGGGGQGGGCKRCDDQSNTPGGEGGGILWIAAQTISFSGSLTANGSSAPSDSKGGGGAGGSIRIEGATINVNAISATGGTNVKDGGVGRIAIYYQSTPPSITSKSPAPYIAPLGQASSTATPAPSATPISLTPSVGGTGADGDLTVSGSYNINAQNSGSHVCAEGGDGVNYSVIELSQSGSWAKLSTSPSSGCLKPGDEIMLINLQGVPGNTANAGKYEFLRVGGVTGNTVYFSSVKVNFYGANAGDDSNIGTGTGQQRVMLMRVPNYHNVTVNGTLYANSWDKTKDGVVAFRASGALSGSGSITMNGRGYWTVEGYAGQSVSYAYGGGENGPLSPGGSFGGGGGYATNGQDGTGHGGRTYGQASLTQLFPGGGGGEGGGCKSCDDQSNTMGGPGGGILWIGAQTISFSGRLTANGASAPSDSKGGGGAGGSIRVEGATINVNAISVAGGTNVKDGGLGRIAIYYSDSLANSATICAQASTYCKNTGATGTPPATPTAPAPTSTVSPTPMPQGWYASDYTYSADIPHAVTSVNRGSFTDSFTYDANGNMTCRKESGVTYLQTYNAENRISSIVKLAAGDCSTPGAYAAKWDFTYDGDGIRTGQAYTSYTDGQPGTAVIARYFFGGAYETTGSTWKKYYSFGGATLMRDADGFKYFLSDHLGSVSVVLDDEGTILEQQRYLPFGGVRTDLPTPEYRITDTDFTYTGQRNIAGTGFMDYKARFYSPTLGRFIQPDSIIPGIANPQSWNRYSYVQNNPILNIDPSGHCSLNGHWIPDSDPACQWASNNQDSLSGNGNGGFVPSSGGGNGGGSNGGGGDTTPLTHKGDPIPGSDKTVAFGGAAAYDIYLEYKKVHGWWNDYGNADFGLAEFLGMWALFESAGNLDTAKVIATIIAQNLYNGGNNPAACPTGKCFNGAFNFMAAYSGGTTGMLNGGTAYSAANEGSYPKAFGDGENKRSLISMLGQMALSRSSLDPAWTQRTGPSNWGNVTKSYPGWKEAVREAANTQKDPSIREFHINGTAANTIYYYYGDAFYYSIAQRDFWNPPK